MKGFINIITAIMLYCLLFMFLILLVYFTATKNELCITATLIIGLLTFLGLISLSNKIGK